MFIVLGISDDDNFITFLLLRHCDGFHNLKQVTIHLDGINYCSCELNFYIVQRILTSIVLRINISWWQMKFITISNVIGM